MEKTKIGKTLEIPRIINGLWQLAGGHDQHVDVATAADYMQPLIDMGLECFDMADHYGDAELVIGNFNQRDGAGRVTALTKWCPAEDGVRTFERAEEAIDLARTRLAQDTIALLQYHVWDYTDDTYLHNLSRLRRLQQMRKIQHIGLTNVDTPHLRLLVDSGFEIATNQVSASVLDRRIQRRGGMGEYCATHGIGLLCYGTLLGGFISEKWLNEPAPELEDARLNWSLRKYLRFITAAGGWDTFQTVLRAVHQVAEKHATTIAAVATRYVLDLPAVAAIIVGTRLTPTSSSHAASTLRALTLHLDDDDRRAITVAQEALTDIPGDCGDEYRRPPYLTASGDLSHHLSPHSDRSNEISTAIARGQRVEYDSRTLWEPLAGYSRAVRVGNSIHVSGTTAHSPVSHPDPFSTGNNGKPDRNEPLRDVVGGKSAASQATHVFDAMERALVTLGGSMRDVVRTRVLLQNLDDTGAVGEIHGWRFGREGIRPANTLVAAKIVGDEMKVEIEAWAEVGSGEKPVLRIQKA